MKKSLAFLKKEIIELIPPFLFFLIVFHVMIYAKSIMQEYFGVKETSSLTATINALIVAKSILLAEALPFVKLFRNKRLIYNVIWKVILYLTLILFIEYLEELIPLMNHGDTFAKANKNIMLEFSSDKFIVVHIILSLFLVIYVITIELVDALGRKQFLQLFFGDRKIAGE